MFLDLSISKFKNLQSVRECGLRSLSFSKVINNFLVWVRLLYVVIVEINDCVAISPRFALYSIVENNFFLAWFESSLDFTVVADDLFNDFLVSWRLWVVFLTEFHVIVIFFFLFFLFLVATILALEFFKFVIVSFWVVIKVSWCVFFETWLFLLLFLDWLLLLLLWSLTGVSF